MPRILLVEDSLTQAYVLRKRLETEGYLVETAKHGAEGLLMLENSAFDLVLTDMVMPEMNGLDFIEALRKLYPTLPAILMTEFGSEDHAAEALQRGATSYIPKRQLDHYLFRTLQNALGFALADRTNRHLTECWQESRTQFTLDCNPDLLPHVVAHYLDVLKLMGICDDSSGIRVSVALTEALDNALYHGNLELKSSWREEGGERWDHLARERLRQSPYQDRKIFLSSCIDRREARFQIRDQGPGYDTSEVPDPTSPENLAKVSGRGLLLIHAFMDEVTISPCGNEISLVKRRDSTV
jgi:CheY-like chemotaxis protein/anti-sigma regulatory factor (Ser/Thr protein kinase)